MVFRRRSVGENLKEPAGARGRAQLDTLWPMGRPFAGAAVPLPARPQGPLALGTIYCEAKSASAGRILGTV